MIATVEVTLGVWSSVEPLNCVTTADAVPRDFWLRMVATEEVALGVGLEWNLGLMVPANTKRIVHDTRR